MGRSMFNAVGDDYVKYVRANSKKTKIPMEHFEYFEAAYLAGGTKQIAEKKAEESQMDGRTIPGIAGIGILAAWFASQINNKDSPQIYDVVLLPLFGVVMGVRRQTYVFTIVDIDAFYMSVSH